MDLEKLREELEIDEGCKYEIYLDHLGYPTFGIGHLVVEHDAEYGWEVGTSIDTVRVHETFMGYTRLSKFKNMKLSVDARNWDVAADEMIDSKWYYQVPNRAERLVERMRNIE